jgi:hypothetical protein
LTETFLSILRAAGEDPGEALKAVVPRDDYRETFLKMTRNLAPTGKVFVQMEIRGPGDRTPIVLSSGSRKLISDALRNSRGAAEMLPEEETTLQGVLRALDLDNDWLEVSVDGTTHRRVIGVSETVDDLIGPMVNRDVRVRVRPGKRGTLMFIDIEQEE